MNAPAPATLATLGPVERAVAVMSAMSKPVAARLVGYLSDDERARMLRAADKLPDIGPADLEGAVALFEQAFIEGSGAIDNLARLEEVFEQRLGEADAPKGRPVWERLAGEDGNVLAERLASENPCLAALVLSRLPTRAGAAMLRGMQSEHAGAILATMSARRAPTATVIEAVERFLARPAKDETDPTPIAAVLNELERDMAEALLTGAKLPEPTVARVRGAMFAFEDVALLAAPDLAILLDAVEGSEVAVALHGADDAFAETMVSALSPRTQRMVEAQRRTVQPTPDAVRDARRDIARRALALIGDGTIARAAAA